MYNLNLKRHGEKGFEQLYNPSLPGNPGASVLHNTGMLQT